MPNIYSLMKKYLRPDERDRPWREDRWYGVKPRDWRSLLSDDLQAQCASQWCGVMCKLRDDRAHDRLGCRLSPTLPGPGRRGATHSSRGVRERANLAADLPRLRCSDDEYLRGAPFRSKNEVDRLEVRSAPGPIELPPFSADEIARIEARCAAIQDRFEVLAQGAGD